MSQVSTPSAASILYGSPPAAPAAAPAPAQEPIAAIPPAPEPIAATPPAPAPAAAPAPAPGHAPAPVADVPALTADAIIASVPADIAKLRAEPSRRMYGTDAALVDALPDDVFEGADPEVQAAIASEVRAIAGDVGLNAADLTSIREAVQVERATPMTEDQRVESREQIVNALNAKFGKGAHQAWLDVRKYVALDPRRAALLQEVGDHPATVLRLVDLAQAAKRAGRLR